MSIGNVILGVSSVTILLLIRYDNLLQNATVLLQNATVITNCDNFIPKCDSYYKMRRLLQIATVHSLIAIEIQNIMNKYKFFTFSGIKYF